ncbi:hypothetical protein E2C01_036507 [Portunus trituberculatus]|uniref:Uncharacterized protein n=1 Tax=Portunus trituberculatus TaxID=210409 RepID=A0A5B7FBD1_PORTR|nr:hypothetical protein [Portunus trituberculatus]
MVPTQDSATRHANVVLTRFMICHHCANLIPVLCPGALEANLLINSKNRQRACTLVREVAQTDFEGETMAEVVRLAASNA